MESRLILETSIPQEYQIIAKRVLPSAEGWLRQLYKLDPGFFKDLSIKLSCTLGRNWYFPDSQEALIRIASTRLYLYDIVEANKTTPPEGLPVGVGSYLMSMFIHEATHFIQQQKGRKYSELETTVNQIDFIQSFDPINYALLINAKGAKVVSGVGTEMFL